MGNAEYDSGRDALGSPGEATPVRPGAGAGMAEIPQGGGRVRVVLMLVALAAALGLVYLTPLRRVLTEVHQLSSWLRGLGWTAPAVFVTAAAALIAIGCPRLLFCPIAGMAFGFLSGLLWAEVGALIGSYATFLFVRWGGREFALKKWPKLGRHAHLIAEKGVVSVVLIRQMPLSGIWISSVLGLTHVSHRDFLVGTAIGTLPGAIPATLLGAGVAQLSVGKGVACILLAAIWFVVVWRGLKWYRRSWRAAAAVQEERGSEAVG